MWISEPMSRSSVMSSVGVADGYSTSHMWTCWLCCSDWGGFSPARNSRGYRAHCTWCYGWQLAPTVVCIHILCRVIIHPTVQQERGCFKEKLLMFLVLIVQVRWNFDRHFCKLIFFSWSKVFFLYGCLFYFNIFLFLSGVHPFSVRKTKDVALRSLKVVISGTISLWLGTLTRWQLTGIVLWVKRKWTRKQNIFCVGSREEQGCNKA